MNKNFLPGDTIKYTNGERTETAWVVFANDFGFGYTQGKIGQVVFEQWTDMRNWERYK